LPDSQAEKDSSESSKSYGVSSEGSGKDYAPGIALGIFWGLVFLGGFGLYKVGEYLEEYNRELWNGGSSYSQSSQNRAYSEPSKKSPLEKKIEKPKEVASFEIEFAKSIGDKWQKYTIAKQDYPGLFERMDLNGDGITSQAELDKIAPKIQAEITGRAIFGADYNKVLKNFCVSDELYSDSKEVTSIQEIENLTPMLSYPANEIRLTIRKKEDYPAFFDRLDLNGDGKVLMKELRKSMPYIQKYVNDNIKTSSRMNELYEKFSPPKKLYTRKVIP
jgi:Ca2+-binding EF-hand superfamily protein